MRLEIRDCVPDGTKFGVRLVLPPHNLEIQDLIKGAFPASNPNKLFLFARMRAANAEKMASHFKSFFETFLQASSEELRGSNLDEPLQSLNLQFGHHADSVIVALELSSFEPTAMLDDMKGHVGELLQDIKLFADIELYFGKSLKTLLGNVGTTHQITRNDGQDQAKLKEINDKSNLLRLFLSGFAFRLKGEVSAQYLKAGRDWIYKELQKPSKQFDLLQALDQKLLRFAAFALNGISLRVNLSEEETFNLFLDSFPRTANWPDALDLIDELGVLVERMRLIREYDNTPFFRAFIDALHDYAKANIEVGLTCESFTLSGSFQTEGLKELFDHIMTGMVDE